MGLPADHADGALDVVHRGGEEVVDAFRPADECEFGEEGAGAAVGAAGDAEGDRFAGQPACGQQCVEGGGGFLFDG